MNTITSVATRRNGHGATAPPSAIGDRQPPVNIEAERGVLGSILLDNRTLDEIAPMLAVEDFYRDAHQILYRGILSLYARHEGIDAITLAAELTLRGELDHAGGDVHIREIVDATPHAANARYYAGIVRERSIARQLVEASDETLRLCYSRQHTASDLVCAAEERIFAISERDVAGDTAAIGVAVDETMARMTLREDGEMLGTPSGYHDLDVLTSGFKGGEVTVLAARPGIGKTSLAMDIAVNVASAGSGVMFVSLEMGREAIGDRFIASQARVDSYHFQRPWLLKPDEKMRIANAANRLMRLPIELDFTAMRTVTQIGACARRMKRRKGLGLVVIDYLQLIDAQAGKGKNRQEEVSEISRGIKVMARNLGVPVLVLSQLNRMVEQRQDKRPVLADLRESGAIEQDADVVWMLYRGDYYDPNDAPGMAEVGVAKNRNGATGTVKLAFERRYTRFDSLATVPEPVGDAPAF